MSLHIPMGNDMVMEMNITFSAILHKTIIDIHCEGHHKCTVQEGFSFH